MTTWADPTGLEQTLTHASSTPRSSLVKPQGSCTQDEVGTTRCRQPSTRTLCFPTWGSSDSRVGAQQLSWLLRGVTHQSP